MRRAVSCHAPLSRQSVRPAHEPSATRRSGRGRSRLICAAVLAACCGLFAATARAAHFTSTWDNSTGDWTDAGKWDTADFPNNNGNTYDAVINGGRVTLDQDIVIQAFNLTDGRLEGGYDLTTNERFTWTGGWILGAGTITAQDGVDLGGSFKYLYRKLVSNDTTRWTAGMIYARNGTFTNNAALLNTFDGTLSSSGGFNRFENTATGSFTKSTATGTTTIAIPFYNDGTVNVEAGRLELRGGGTSTGQFNVNSILEFGGGTHNVNATAVVQGSGDVEFTGGTTNLAGTYDVSGTTTISGGTANFNGTVSNLGSTVTLSGTGTLGGTGDLLAQGTFDFSGGSMKGSGSTTIAGGAALNLNGSHKYLYRQLVIDGTADWTAGAIYVFGGTFVNNGTFTNSFAGDIASYGGTSRFENAAGGTFTKHTAAGTTTVAVPFDNHGTVNAETGRLALSGGGTSTGEFKVNSTLEFGGGTHHVNASAVVHGPGQVEFSGGTTTLEGTYDIAGATIVSGGTVHFNGPINALGQSLTVSGGTANFNGDPLTVGPTTTLSGNGTLGGSSDVIAEGTFDFGGGTMNGAGSTTIAGGATLNLFGSYKYVSRRLINDGTANWTDGPIYVWNTTLTNNSTLITSCDEELSSYGAGGGSFHNAATGVFTKNTATGTTTISVPFDSAGTVNVETGRLTLSGGGTSAGEFNVSSVLEFASPAYDVDNPGAVQGSGEVVFSSGATNLACTYDVAGATTITAGTANFEGNVVNLGSTVTLSDNGTLGGNSDVVATGSFDFGEGTMAGTGSTTIATGGTLNLTGGYKYLHRTLVNDGTANWTAGPIYTWNATITNNGTLTNSFDGLLAGYGGVNRFDNNGTFTKSGDTGTTTIGIPFHNQGTVNIQSGTLRLTAPGTGAGAFHVSAGAKLDLAQAYTMHAGSSLDNQGTVEIEPNRTLTVQGTVTQISAGTLTGGTWLLGAGSTLGVTGGTDVHTNQGTVVLNQNSRFNRINALADNQGSFAILGGRDFTTLGSLTNSGTLTVGYGTTLEVTGDLTMEEGSLYACELGPADHGLITAVGDVLLNPSAEGGSAGDGTTLALQVVGKLAAPGTKNPAVIIAEGPGGVIGTFAHEPAEGDYLGYGVFYQGLTYAGAPEKITAVEVNLLQGAEGDADGDGDVDPSDLSTLVQNWAPAGTDKVWREGNFDDYQDGNVDPSDLSGLVQNWAPAGYGGEAVPGQLGGSASVPEPGTLVLLAAAGVALLLFRRRRTRTA